MTQAEPKTRIFIDALALTSPHMSGVGHNLLEIVKALSDSEDFSRKATLYLIQPLGKRSQLMRFEFNEHVKIKTIPLPARVFQLLIRLNLLPPLDLFVGRGIYLFPNYRNWPLLKSPSYTYVHDTVFMRYPQFVQPRNLAFLRKHVPDWIARSTKVITLSEFSKKEIMHYFSVPESKIAVVPCGVDTKIFYPRSQEEISEVLNKHGLPIKSYLLYLGNIEPRKNLTRLIRAFDSLPQNLKDEYNLLFVGGDGWLNEDIKAEMAKARTNGATIIQPSDYINDDDLPALISGASLLVHPALYEGFGISPLQAMACGTPVVVANTSSLPEVVGDAGLYVDPENIKDISDKIQKALLDKELAASLREKGNVQALKYSWEASGARLAEAINVNVGE